MKEKILVTGRNDKNWYFDNAVSYHMTFDLADFQKSELTKCQQPRDNITLANGSIILPDELVQFPSSFVSMDKLKKSLYLVFATALS